MRNETYEARGDVRGIPMPSSALVVDVRQQATSSTLLPMLKKEIDTVYDEMQMAQSPVWRSLKNTLDFLSSGVLSADDLCYHPKKWLTNANNGNGKGGVTVPSDGDESRLSLDPDPQNPLDKLPRNSTLKKNLDEMNQRCREMYNICLNAYSGLDMLAGTTLGERVPRPRIFFIVDASQCASLETAATYAFWLQLMNLHTHRAGEANKTQFDVFLLCLNCKNFGQFSHRFVESLECYIGDTNWLHIAKCIVIEEYDERNGWLDRDDQERFVQFLLYTLLLTNQSIIDIKIPGVEEVTSLTIEKQNHLSWPAGKFLTVAQAAYTYSAHQGRDFLSDGLVQQALQEMLNSTVLDKEDETRAVEKWLGTQRRLIEEAIPEQYIADLPPMRSLIPANKPPQVPNWGSTAAKSAEKRLNGYVDRLKKNYTDTARGLQGVVDNLPRIGKDVIAKQEGKETHLGQVLQNVRSMVTSEPFYKGGRGAIPRTEYQLSELARLVAQIHVSKPLSPQNAQEELADYYQAERDELKELHEKKPFGARFWSEMRWFFITVIALVLIIIVLANATVIQSWVASIIYIVWIVAVLLVCVIVGTIFTTISIFTRGGASASDDEDDNQNKRKSGWRLGDNLTIIVVCCALLALAVMLIFFFELILAIAAVVPIILPWLIASVVVALVAIWAVEMFITNRDYRNVQEVYLRAAQALQQKHEVYIASLKQAVADETLVQLFQYANIINHQEKTGQYFTNLKKISTILQTVHGEVQKAYDTVQQQLHYLSRHHSDVEPSGTLLYRQELLNITELVRRSEIMREQFYKQTILDVLAQSVMLAGSEEKQGQEIQRFALYTQEQQQRYDSRQLTYALALMLRVMTGISAEQASDIARIRSMVLDCQGGKLDRLIHDWESKRSAEQSYKPDSVADRAVFMAIFTAWGQSYWEPIDIFKDLFTPGDLLSHLASHGANNAITTLNRRAALMANALSMAQYAESYYLVFPYARTECTESGREFLSRLDRDRNAVIDFPDRNVIATLWFMYYTRNDQERSQSWSGFLLPANNGHLIARQPDDSNGHITDEQNSDKSVPSISEDEYDKKV